MRSRTPADLRGRCPRCFLPSALCLCADIPVVRLETPFVIVRHVKQAWKTSNTARIAALALAGSELLDYGGEQGPFDDTPLVAPGTRLLFPGEPSAEAPAPPARVVVVDGSWSQARRMTQRLASLRTMPRLSLAPPSPQARRLRRAPRPEAMSTLEAVAHAVAQLAGEETARPLFWLHEEHRRRVQLTWGRRAGTP